MKATRHSRRAAGDYLGSWGGKPGAGTGLLIDPCSSIHMFFMRFPIDVVYLNKEYIVVKSAHLPTWRLSSGGRGAKKAIELPAGHAVEYNVRVGEQLTLAPLD